MRQLSKVGAKNIFVLLINEKNSIGYKYLEILTQKVGAKIANNVIELIINRTNVEFVEPTFSKSNCFQYFGIHFYIETMKW